jgi:hypothetical protein
MSDDADANIYFSIDDSSNRDNDSDGTICCNGDIINEFMNDVNNVLLDSDLSFQHIINYSENATVKELLIICDYYGFAKELKANKCNKGEIIQILVDFEMNPLNNEVVYKRRTMWFYAAELKNDKFMKKFVLW